jgi:uncharacterized membrane protein
MVQDTIDKGKTAAITSYILIVGVLIAISMNSETKNPFAAFHIRQSLGLSITFIGIGSIVSSFESPMITYPFWIFIIVLWSYGFMTAIRGEMINIPLIGNYFQKWFKSI